jgi:hypothetical protein
MNKARIILAIIGLFTIIGSLFAYNIRATSGYITVNGVTQTTTTGLVCTYRTMGCTVLYQGRAYQLFLFDGNIYYPVGPMPL